MTDSLSLRHVARYFGQRKALQKPRHTQLKGRIEALQLGRLEACPQLGNCAGTAVARWAAGSQRANICPSAAIEIGSLT
jgi:hypothetical protein